MSKARKVFRLFKWIKELERARLSSHNAEEDHAVPKVALKVLTHLFAASYYFVGLLTPSVVCRTSKKWGLDDHNPCLIQCSRLLTPPSRREGRDDGPVVPLGL